MASSDFPTTFGNPYAYAGNNPSNLNDPTGEGGGGLLVLLIVLVIILILVLIFLVKQKKAGGGSFTGNAKQTVTTANKRIVRVDYFSWTLNNSRQMVSEAEFNAKWDAYERNVKKINVSDKKSKDDFFLWIHENP